MELKEQLKQIDKELTVLNNKRYELNEKYIKELYNNCQKNIGKCFKTTWYGYGDGYITYYKIISTQDIQYQMHGGSYFDENTYEYIEFKYPYNNSLKPFIIEDENLSIKLNNKEIEEISKEEFNKKFNQINKQWVDKINKE